MRVKRYLVDSMPDALQQIRSDLGKNAVILNTKEIRARGLQGWLGKRKIEVIAAAEGSAEEAADSAAAAEAHAKPLQAAGAIKAAYNSAASLSRPMKPRLAYSAPTAEANAGTDPQDSGRKGAYPTAANSVPADSDSAREVLLLGEIRQMKEMVRRLSTCLDPGIRQPEALRELGRRLESQDLDAELAQQILQEIAGEAGARELGRTEAWALARGKLLNILGRSGRQSISGENRVIHFVGPTGAGKTTTIAKLAAEQVLMHRRKVGFITADTYRISAVEQLKTYASILGAPLEVVYSPQDLPRALERLGDREMIFMDTAGRNYRSELYVSEWNALKRSLPSSETYLVLSLTSKYRDMKAIVENFRRFDLDTVLFTKLDETDSYGAVVNLLHEYPLRLSYGTVGQNVPDDIAELDAGMLADRILGDGGNE